MLERAIELEVQLRDVARVEMRSDEPPDEAGGSLERTERLLLLFGATLHGNVDARMPEIRAHFDARHADEANAGVAQFPLDDRADFVAKKLGESGLPIAWHGASFPRGPPRGHFTIARAVLARGDRTRSDRRRGHR